MSCLAVAGLGFRCFILPRHVDSCSARSSTVSTLSEQCEQREYFSGLGNILSFLLSSTLQMGQVKFLQRVVTEDQSEDKEDDEDDDDDDSPTFLISVEVGYEAAGLAALLQWVQRARLERNTGHLAVYTGNTPHM